jgi:predicted GNAT family acetyltransferase
VVAERISPRRLEKAGGDGNLDSPGDDTRERQMQQQMSQAGVAPSAVRDDKARQRFELDAQGAVAFANYRRAANKVIITHTETPAALRGRGIASALVKGALDLIRADGLKVVAGCGFVADYLEMHPEYADLVA